MKKTKFQTITIIFLLFFFSAGFSIELSAQEAPKDTTKIQMGKKKIIIIKEKDKLEEKIDALQGGIMDFKTEKYQLQDSIDNKKEKVRKSKNEQEKKQLQDEIDDFEKQIAALEKGIEQIEGEIEELREKRRENRNNDSDFDNFFDDDWNWDFYWDKRVRRFNGHWSGIELGISTFMNKNHKMDLPTDGEFLELKTASWAVNLNFLEYNIMHARNNKIGLTTGMGIEWNNFKFKKGITLYEDMNGIIRGVEMQDSDFEKNKLHTSYLTIPLLFEIQSGNDKYRRRFYLNFGIVGSVKIGSKTKQVYEKNNNKYKSKVRGDFNLNTFRYAATARMGYKGLQLFANYNLVPLFKNNKGPEVYPLTVGLRLVNF